MEPAHPVLGVISKSEESPDCVEAVVSYSGRPIPIRIDPDDQTLEDAIEFATEVVSALATLEPTATRIVVRDLCPTYNNGWNEYDEVQDDGTTKTVRNPKLADDEFAAKLTLKDISITGNESIEFWYDDSNMFWGHGVLVSALDKLDLSKAQAQLFG